MKAEDEVQAANEEAVLTLEDEAPVEPEIKSDEIEAIDEEEEYECIPCLPAQYQPSLSEFLDHCVTHYPFRAWCPHCIEGRVWEFGHGNQKGPKEHSACPVVSFVYAFVSDHDDIATQQGFEAAVEGAA